ncbi:MAG: thioesterase family protein [Myxococcota bacterium]|nr:thioesterase family protein [Myxococcota bacterium]
MGHVNNAVYFTYFEHARIGYTRALMDAAGSGAGSSPGLSDIRFILADATCRYRSPAHLGERLVVGIHVPRVGRKSFAFDYRSAEERSGRLVAEGSSTQVWYDYAASRSLPVPDDVVALMEKVQRAPIPRS